MPFAQWQFLVEFSPSESCYFSILCAILLKLNIFAHLIESSPTVSGLSSCIERKYRSLGQPILQWPCTLVVQCHFLHFQMLLFFGLTSYPGEISYFDSPNRELSNDLLDVVVRRRKVAPHTSSHLKPTEAWRSPDSTTSEGRRVSSEVRLGNCT